jgi:hypothetical protein
MIFYSTSECRDLVFTTQEHRMTLPRDQGVPRPRMNLQPDRAGGRSRDRAALRGARFPADTAMIDLDLWHAFEQDNPQTFAAMYRFWVQKAEP